MSRLLGGGKQTGEEVNERSSPAGYPSHGDHSRPGDDGELCLTNIENGAQVLRIVSGKPFEVSANLAEALRCL